MSRRHVFGAASALGLMLGGGARAAGPNAPGPNAIPPDEALARLQEGHARYLANAPMRQDPAAGRARLATAQHPIAAFISCADSRVVPDRIFDQAPGSLFVVRVAGNYVTRDGLASLEYGVAVLGIPLLVVLGHSNCGAVAATLRVLQEDAKLPGYLPALAEAMRPGVARAIAQQPEDLTTAATVENVRHGMEVLGSASTLLTASVKAGRVKVAGAVYDIASGGVRMV
ncbi:carbonic anhydrase [Roseomonas xinghualingensis]|uniref:carbonic anhydrase n=1 Tax=Roseomonas xinghualingensis TaxID=2986475 RepID=UPI0021F1FD2A|nr:carbonic anhydrase [Roseomonas sp. SXEYE001]MCV4208216.1 carbonic anhydrase [Roseomonas sp. SXEYE001]